MPIIIACIIIGILLGGAQELTKTVLNRFNDYRGIYPYILAITLFYALATVQWIKVLRSEPNLTSCYALVVLGVFIGLKLAAFISRGNTPDLFTFQDAFGILLIFTGCIIIRR